jgi:BioD-like phosphotransacetylase family protein
VDERPVGHRPEADRSDWTEQDLLTREEALPRLEEAMAEVEAELESEQDPTARSAIAERLAAMNAIRDRLLTPGL